MNQMEHVLKIRKPLADAVLSGERTFDVRQNDSAFQRGDTVRFAVIDELRCVTSHPVDKKVFEISYVVSGYGLKEGFVAFSFREMVDEA